MYVTPESPRLPSDFYFTFSDGRTERAPSGARLRMRWRGLAATSVKHTTHRLRGMEGGGVA